MLLAFHLSLLIVCIQFANSSSMYGSLICQYGGYCRVDSDCVPGNKCQISSQYYSQCIPDQSTYSKLPNCLSNWGQKCTSSSQCCDPGAYCNSQSYSQCQQPAQNSGSCLNPNGFAPILPSSSPNSSPTVSPTTKSPVYYPTLKPKSTAAPTQAVRNTDSTKTSTPSVEPTAVGSSIPSTYSPSISPSNMPSNSPTSIPTSTPSVTPSNTPTFLPTSVPFKPTLNPTSKPPTNAPLNPSSMPTSNPISTFSPSSTPTITLLPTIKSTTIAPTSVSTFNNLQNGNFSAANANWMSTASFTYQSNCYESKPCVVFIPPNTGMPLTYSGTLMQTVNTVPGATYMLKYTLRLFYQPANSVRYFSVFWDNQLVPGSTINTNSPLQSGGVYPFSFAVVAYSQITTLLFDVHEENSIFSLLDVTLQITNTPLVVTPNLVINGDFSLGTSYWLDSNPVNVFATYSCSGVATSCVKFVGAVNQVSILFQVILTIPGALYTITYTLTNTGGVGPQFFSLTWNNAEIGASRISNSDPSILVAPSTQIYQFTVVATAPDTVILFAGQHPNGFLLSLVSVVNA